MNSETFREFLVHEYAGEMCLEARTMRALRRRVPGTLEPTPENTKALPAALVSAWKRLWSAWRKDHPAPEEQAAEVDNGLKYFGVHKTAEGYRAEFTIREVAYKRGHFPTAQAAARYHDDEMRRQYGTEARRLNFPTPEEIEKRRKYVAPVRGLATIKKRRPPKELKPLQVDVPGAVHGVVISKVGGYITAVHSGKYLGTFPDIRSAQIAYNNAVLAAPRHSVGKRALLNYIEPEEAQNVAA